MLFQLQITAFRSQFLQQVLIATKYLAVDHPELSPPWRGILCEATQLYGIEWLLAQELVGWDPRYGLPLLHNYTIIAGNITASGSTFFLWFPDSCSTDWVVHQQTTFSIYQTHCWANYISCMHFRADISAVQQQCWSLEPSCSQQHTFGNSDWHGKFFLD